MKRKKEQQGGVKKTRTFRKRQLAWYKDLMYLGMRQFLSIMYWLLGLALLGKKGQAVLKSDEPVKNLGGLWNRETTTIWLWSRFYKSSSSPLLDVSSQISTIHGMLTSLITGCLVLQCWKNWALKSRTKHFLGTDFLCTKNVLLFNQENVTFHFTYQERNTFPTKYRSFRYTS